MVATVDAVPIRPVYRLAKPTPTGPSNTARTLERSTPIAILMNDAPPIMEVLFNMRWYDAFASVILEPLLSTRQSRT
jgi:hypothetical protein